LLQDGGIKNGTQKEIIFLVSPRLVGKEDQAEAAPAPASQPKTVTVTSDSISYDSTKGVIRAGGDVKIETASGTLQGKDAKLTLPEAKTPEIQKTAAEKLAETIIIPEIILNDATLDDSLEFLRIRGKQLDVQKQGVNIIVFHSDNSRNAKLTLSLRNVTMCEALKYIATLSGMEIEADDHTIMLKPAAKKAK
jgi:hypothetical protein